jgi:hypothetical protein
VSNTKKSDTNTKGNKNPGNPRIKELEDGFIPCVVTTDIRPGSGKNKKTPVELRQEETLRGSTSQPSIIETSNKYSAELIPKVSSSPDLKPTETSPGNKLEQNSRAL